MNLDRLGCIAVTHSNAEFEGYLSLNLNTSYVVAVKH